jgi:hypothetical protein
MAPATFAAYSRATPAARCSSGLSAASTQARIPTGNAKPIASAGGRMTKSDAT